MVTNQEKAMEYQFLSQQLQQLQQQAQAVDQQQQELQALEENLDDLRKAKSGNEIFVNIGGGILVKATLGDMNTAYVTAGAGAVVPKTIEEAKIIIAQQNVELQEFSMQLQNALQQVMMKLQELQTNEP